MGWLYIGEASPSKEADNVIKIDIVKDEILYIIKLYNGNIHLADLDINPLNFEPKELLRRILNTLEERGIKYDIEDLKNEIYSKLIILKPIKVDYGESTYMLLAPDGFKASHTGFFLKLNDEYIVGELFYAYTYVKKPSYGKKGEVEIREYNTVIPYLLIFRYGSDLEKIIKPIERDELDLGDRIIRLKRKSLAENSLETQMDLNTVKLLYNLDLDRLRELGNLNLIYINLVNIIKENIWVGNEIYYSLIALWIIGTYFSDIFRIYPILHIYGSSGSGKTRLLSLTLALSRRGFPITDPSDANIYRVIEGYRPTLGLDDFDKLIKRYRPVLVSLLKHVYKDVIAIPRLEKVKGDRFILGLFSMYAPTVVTSVDRLESGLDESLGTQLETRYIEIEMIRSRRSFRNVDFTREYADIRSKLYIARFLYADKIYNTYYEVDTGLYGRNDELWRPILTIAKLIDEELYNNIRNYAFEYSKLKEEEFYQEEKLIIRGIERFFEQKTLEEDKVKEIEFTVSDLLGNLKIILVEEDKELSDKDFERQWSPQRLGRILERMHIPKKRRAGRERTRLRIVDKKLLKELKLRYGYIDEEDSEEDISDIKDNNIDTLKDKQVENIQPFNRKNSKSSSEKSSNTSNIMSLMSEMSSEEKDEASASKNVHIWEIPPDLREYYEDCDDVSPYFVKCRLCGSYSGRNPKDLEGHLNYHFKRGEANA